MPDELAAARVRRLGRVLDETLAAWRSDPVPPVEYWPLTPSPQVSPVNSTPLTPREP